MFCIACKRTVRYRWDAAMSKRGAGRVWARVCVECGARYEGPPLGARALDRQLTRAGQLSLDLAFPDETKGGRR